jgi:glycosyltransferase involved in cell wall biosynthesis
MIRVLHLASEAGGKSDFSARQGRDALIARLGGDFEQTVQIIGRGGRFRNRFDAILQLRREKCDLIHAWDGDALLAATIGGCGAIVFSPSRLPTRPATRWLSAAMRYRPIHVVLPGQTQLQTLLRRGIAPERCYAIRPGVDFSRVRGRRDAELRRRLGLTDSDYAVLAPGESDRPNQHLLALWVVSILHVYDPSYKLVLWGQGEQLAHARRLAEHLRQPDLLRTGTQLLGPSAAFDELPAACDAVVITADESAAMLPTAICMAAALPIVSITNYALAELLEDHHTALMVPKPSPRLLAQRLLALRGDPVLSRKLGDRARAEAFDYCSLTRFVQEYRDMYSKVIDNVPSPGVPGEGMGFFTASDRKTNRPIAYRDRPSRRRS